MSAQRNDEGLKCHQNMHVDQAASLTAQASSEYSCRQWPHGAADTATRNSALSPCHAAFDSRNCSAWTCTHQDMSLSMQEDLQHGVPAQHLMMQGGVYTL